MGAAGAGLMASAGMAELPEAEAAVMPARAHQHARSHPHGVPADSQHFGRMFPELKPFADASDRVRGALLEVGKRGGIMDANDDLGAGPKPLILDPAVNGNPTPANPYGTNPDNPTMTAGSTFVGQFIDHDVTFDQTSHLGVPQDPQISPNTRTPALDLDSVFGGGPGLRPDLYVRNQDGSVGPKLKIGSGGVHEDVPRISNGDGTYRTLLGDPRNDEHVIIAGLHCAHIMFYNRVLDDLRQINLRVFPAARHADLTNRYERFLIARQITLWHYQWLLVNEHLPQIVGRAMTDHVLRRGGRYYRPPATHAFMPIEFGAAAYRFGHSLVRPSYRANFTSGTGDSPSPSAAPFFALVFHTTAGDPGDRDDLLGGSSAPRRYVGWQTFFDFGDGQVKNNKKVDTTISSVLFTLPLPAIAPHTQTTPTVLPQRNLLRQLTWGLPSGQALAHHMRVDHVARGDLSEIADVYKPFGRSTPLGTTSSRKPETATDGLHLGPVGGRIVAETLIGLLRADPHSYLNCHPRFRPFLGADLQLGNTPNPNIAGDRTYTRAHFLYYAGVVTPGTYR